MKLLTKTFLHWHASSKMRLGDFKGASVIYAFLNSQQALRKEAHFAYAFCLLRNDQTEEARRILQQLHHYELNAHETELCTRLERRLEVRHDGLE